MREPTLWKIFCRKPGATEDYAEQAISNRFIAIGWGGVGSLARFRTPEELDREFDRTCEPHMHGASMLWKFKNEVATGDWVCLPSSKANTYYFGRVGSGRYEFVDADEFCPFEHRRPVEWIHCFDQGVIDGKFGDRMGGILTLSKVEDWSPLGRLLRSKQRSKAKGKIPSRPDPEWGRLGELRAMAWLEERLHRRVRDVAALALGWDLEVDDRKFEVKTRRPGNVVCLSRWEYEAARNHRRDYTLLVLTATDKSALKKAVPRSYRDPASLAWTPRYVPEYHWNPDA
jgi:hypothetical protein